MLLRGTYDMPKNHLQVIIPTVSTLRQSLAILHQVPEGHVGVYWRGGALLNTITDPGLLLCLIYCTSHVYDILDICVGICILGLGCFLLLISTCSIFRFSFEIALDNPLRAHSSDPTDWFGERNIYPLQFRSSLDEGFISLQCCLKMYWLASGFRAMLCTMQVRDIPCGTKGGVMINFEKIEVHLSVLFSCVVLLMLAK